MLLRVDDITRRIGGRTLFSGVAFQVAAGDRLGLVGPNGAGKSTLLRVIAGDEHNDGGTITTRRGVRVAMLRQEINPGSQRTVRAEAALALAHLDALEADLRAMESEMEAGGRAGDAVPAELAERYDRAHGTFEHGGGFQREARVAEMLEGLGFDDEARARPLAGFSGGWLMRVELAKLLLSDPDVLLLDEPTNHLDLPAIEWFENTLQNFDGAAIVVSHDRSFLRRHVGRVAELDGLGRFTLYEGGYDRYLTQRAERRTQLLARKDKQDREIAQMERFVERFRAKATKAKQAQSRIKALNKIERIEIQPEGRRRMRLRIPPPPRSGDRVLTLEGIHKRYGDVEVYQGIDFAVQRGDRVALAGPNGAGKSTLLRIAAGSLSFEEGDRVLGHNVSVVYFAQHQLEALDAGNSVLEEMMAGAQLDDIPRLRGQLGAFLFSGDDVDKKVSVLSGGEKARLALAKMLLRPANFLVLDEPTNHLDIEACEVLEEALKSFAGTLIFVSHDRSFINALATRVVEVEAGVLEEYLGNYDDFQRRKSERAETRRRRAQDPADVSQQVAAPAPETPSAPKPRLSKQERRAEREQQKAEQRVQRRVERIEAEILEREQRHEAAGWEMGAPEIASDPDSLVEIETQRSELQTEIDSLYREWERLTDELAAIQDGSEPDSR